ncbi:MAG: hypothetical protein U0470_06905 [Anaerolineae bacterium]
MDEVIGSLGPADPLRRCTTGWEETTALAAAAMAEDPAAFVRGVMA